MLTNKGMLENETVGLRPTNLVVNAEILHVIVQPHALRLLKTKANN